MQQMLMTHRQCFQERSVPTPEIGPHDVLVKVSYVGVCGSDMALFEYGRIGDHAVTEPMVLGHEASGIVVKIGQAVNTLEPGDRVALEPGVPCGHCQYCQEGSYNLCIEVSFWASLPNTEGTLQEYVRHPARYCHKLPQSLSLLEGALIEPLSVSIHAMSRTPIKLGSTAVIFGAGCIGQLTLLTLRASGVHDIVVVDPMHTRLLLARQMGAQTINSTEVTDVSNRVHTLLGSSPDVAIECSGSESGMNAAIKTVCRGGHVTLIGYTKSGDASLKVNDIIDKELSISTAFRYRHIYPRAIRAVASRAIDVKSVVSSIYDFEYAEQAFRDAIHSKAEVTKCVIKVDRTLSDEK